MGAEFSAEKMEKFSAAWVGLSLREMQFFKRSVKTTEGEAALTGL